MFSPDSIHILEQCTGPNTNTIINEASFLHISQRFIQTIFIDMNMFPKPVSVGFMTE